MNFFKHIYYFTILVFCLTSCVKKKSYSDIPIIEFKDFKPYTNQSGDLEIKFKDGDGDIGNEFSDSTLNFYAVYYYKDTITNKYRAYTPCPNNCDTLRSGYIIRKPENSYQGKPISGEVSVRLQSFRHSTKIKHIKFVIYLFDNAKHKSNVVTTPEFNLE